MIWGYVRPQSTASDSPRGAGATQGAGVTVWAIEVANGPQIGAETVDCAQPIAPCGCDDHSIARLRDMVRAGMGQMEASRAIWGAT